MLNQVYANVLGKPVLVPSSKVTGIGSAVFAFLAAGIFKTVEEAQQHICPSYVTFTPQIEQQAVYDELYSLYRRLYFHFGGSGGEDHFGDVLPSLIRIARRETSKAAASGSELIRK